MQDRRRKEPEIGHCTGNIERARKRERLACINRFSSRKFLEIAFDQVGNMQQKFRSLRSGFFGPINKRLLCDSDGGFYIAAVAIRDLRIRFASGRFDIVEVLSADWLYELTVDEVLDLR